MTLATAAVAGATVGVFHSLEADHVAAVATLVEGESPERAGLVGTSWGVGHALPITVVGVLALAVGASLHGGTVDLFEALAGVVLVVLGVRVLASLRGVVEHSHGASAREGADRGERRAVGHGHRSLGPIDVGLTHSHREGESFLVGVVHGLAGSGAFVVFLVSTAPTVPIGLVVLGAFALASLATMGALAAVWGRVVSGTAGRALQGAAALASVVVGAALVVGVLTGTDPLSGLALGG